MRPRWLDRLGVRLNLWYGAIFVLAFGLAVFGARRAAVSAIEDEQHLLLARELEVHRARLEGSGLDGLSGFIAERRRQTTLRWFVRVSDADGHTLLFDGPRAELAFAADVLAPREEGARSIAARREDGDETWRLASTRVRGRLWLQVGADEAPQEALVARIERSLWFVLLAGVVVASLGGLVVTRRALAPVRELSAACEQIVNDGAVDVRVSVGDGRGELDRLAVQFNRVLERNRRLVEGMRHALDNVAHDLRTPLSRLRSGAELALAADDGDDRLRDALGECLEETDRVLTMLGTLMDISEAESGVMRLRREPVSMAGVASEAADLYQLVAEQRGIALTLASRDDGIVEGDHQRLLRATANLIDNALKYTDAGGRVTVAVDRGEGRVRLRIADTGMGIERQDLERIWERLYRADRSRSRQGLGLGLSVVKAIVEAHGGTVAVSSSPGQGATFEIALPARNPSS